MNEREIFDAAAAISDPDEQVRFLAHACADDTARLRRLEELLDAGRRLGSFLESPVAAPCPFIDPAINSQLVLEKPGTRIGPYQLLRQIGEGGMGVVWMAEQQEPVSRKVAIKVIKPGLDTRQVLARFDIERQALSLMDHPNIARVLDAGLTDSGRPYFVMELVTGEPITRYCDTRQLTLCQRLELLLPVCHAIQHAHLKGIIHRDIKPSNILVSEYDGQPAPKVIDFGVAKATSQPLTDKSVFTSFGQILGTLDYMSPEQARLNQLDVDTRTDVYSLGVLMYELLTGSLPFDRQRLRAAAWDERLRIIREEEPPRPSIRLSDSRDSLPSIFTQRQTDPMKLPRLLRGELDWIVMKALEKERARRYETVSQLADDVQRYLNNEPVSACPPTVCYKFTKFYRQHKLFVVATAAVATALIAGGSAASWQAIRASQQRDRAVLAETLAQARLENEILQRERAEAAEAKATTEAANAAAEASLSQAVRDFLEHDLLLQADPLIQARGLHRFRTEEFSVAHNPTVKELLDRAAAGLAPERIEQKFPAQPRVQAQLLHTLGRAYRSIGHYALAIELLERANNVFSTVRDTAQLDALQNLNTLGRTLLEGGRRPESIRLLEQVRDSATPHASAAAVLEETLELLSSAYLEAGRISDSIQLCEQLRLQQEHKEAEGHPQALSNLNNLALSYLAAGRQDDAIVLLTRVREHWISQRGPDDPETLIATVNLATALSDADRYPECRQLCEDARQKVMSQFGPQHNVSLSLLNMLAIAYRNSGNPSEAIELLREIHHIWISTQGTEHPRTITTGINLAWAFQVARRSQDAIALGEILLPAATAKLGADHANTSILLSCLAAACMDSERWIDAIRHLEQLRDSRRATLTELNDLAHAYLAADRSDAAILLLEPLLAAQRLAAEPDRQALLALQNKLGSAYQSAGRTDEAVKVFRELESECAAAFGPHDQRTLRTLNQLTEIAADYLEAENFTAAAELFRWLLDRSPAGNLQADSRRAMLLAGYGTSLMQIRQWKDAETAIRDALDMRYRIQPDHWMTFRTMSLLGECLLEQQHYSEAESLLIKGSEGMLERSTQIPPPARFRLVESVAALVSLYTKLEKPEEAARWQNQLETLMTETPAM